MSCRTTHNIPIGAFASRTHTYYIGMYIYEYNNIHILLYTYILCTHTSLYTCIFRL